MASTMIDVLVLLFVVFSILLLSTGFDRFLTILFTRPSTREGQKFLTAIEDMVLPMGSFPPRLLYPWSTTLNSYNSTPLPSTGNNESKQEAVPAPNEPTHIQNRTKEIPILSVTPLTIIEIEPSVESTSPPEDEFHVFENEIRGLIDPKGLHSPQSKFTKELVADMINKHAEDVNGLRRDLAKKQEESERNAQEHKTKYHELELEKNILSREKEREKEESLELETQNKCLKIQIEEEIKDRKDAVTKADKAEEVANAGVQKRIEESKTGLEQNKKAAEDKLRQERDSEILSKRQIESELAEARSEVDVLKEQQKTASKEETAIINQYKDSLRQERLGVTTSKNLAKLAERKLEAFRNEKFVKDSDQVSDLKKRLRASKDLAKSLEPWKTKAENHERICQRLREELTNAAEDVREKKDHKIIGLELDIRGLRRDMATDEVTIDRLQNKIAELESGKEMQELKTELEKEKSTAVDNAIQQAETAAAGKAAEKEQEYEQHIKSAVQDAMNNAAGKAAEKEQEYEQRIKSAVQDAMTSSAEKAAEKKQEYEMAMRAEAENATMKAVAEIKRKAAAENAAAEVEKQAARETEMDITPDPGADAAQLEKVLRQEHQNEIAKAVKDAVENALENANQLHQQRMAQAVQDAVQATKLDHEKEKNDLIAAKEATGVAQQAQEAPDKVQTKSFDAADRQTSNNPIDLTLAATEADEAGKLLEEVVKNGVAMDTVEHSVLRRVTDIRGVLHTLKSTLELPSAPTDTDHYKDMLRVCRLEERVLERLENETNHKLLVRQGRLANERLRKVSEILETSGVQKDAILQALIGPKRQVAPIRGLKRPTQSKKPQVDNSQPSADVPPTPSARPMADNRQPFDSILKSVQNS